MDFSSVFMPTPGSTNYILVIYTYIYIYDEFGHVHPSAFHTVTEEWVKFVNSWHELHVQAINFEVKTSLVVSFGWE